MELYQLQVELGTKRQLIWAMYQLAFGAVELHNEEHPSFFKKKKNQRKKERQNIFKIFYRLHCTAFWILVP